MSNLKYPTVAAETYAEAFRDASVRLEKCRSAFRNSLAISSSDPSDKNIQETVDLAGEIVPAVEDFLEIRSIIVELRNAAALVNPPSGGM